MRQEPLTILGVILLVNPSCRFAATNHRTLNRPQRHQNSLSSIRFSDAPGRNRTYNLSIKSRMLCQLSYGRGRLSEATRQEGLEPPTHSLEGCCSIHLSYWRIESVIPHIGATGFEPVTSCSQSRRDTRLRYAPSASKKL
jgi:hypothetical protein